VTEKLRQESLGPGYLTARDANIMAQVALRGSMSVHASLAVEPVY
jgi:hypothetical protein